MRMIMSMKHRQQQQPYTSTHIRERERERKRLKKRELKKRICPCTRERDREKKRSTVSFINSRFSNPLSPLLYLLRLFFFLFPFFLFSSCLCVKEWEPGSLFQWHAWILQKRVYVELEREWERKKGVL